MPIPAKYSDKFFFHFTHIENLDSILKNEILCTNKKNELGISHIDVASESIQERRSNMKVSCDPKGKVHDYVPCYFCSMNPMFLSLVNSKNIDQQFMIFFAFKIDKILGTNVVFTDASANTGIPPNFYNNPDNLDKLDWDAIDSKKWSNKNEEERHKRMAEVLIFEKIPIKSIDAIIVWNEGIKKKVIDIFKNNGIAAPPISYTPFKDKYHFHYTKFMLGLENQSLITGPYFLKKSYKDTIKKVLEKRTEPNPNGKYLFENIEDALEKIDKNFCAIKEMEDIYKLETKNEVHSENVSDHTLKVVAELEKLDYYNDARNKDKNILKLSAYLHDIGKGPKSKWKEGKQPAYPDHPADAPKMLERILVEDFKYLSEYEIRKICILVTYHDLIGEIIGKGRSLKQLIAIVDTEKTLEMLATLNFADVSAINRLWKSEYQKGIENLKKEVLEKIS